MATHACILRKSDNSVLLRVPIERIQKLEGNYYFPAEFLDSADYEISDRTYTCPQKGVCNWVDLKTDKGYVNDVAWVYAHAKRDYEHIAGLYGFYSKHKYYYYSECD